MYRRLLNSPFRRFATNPPILRSLGPRQPVQTRTMSLMQRNSGAGFPSLSRALNDLESFLNRPAASHDMLGHYPRFDVRETKDSYRLDGDLPGVDKKDIDIELSDDNILTIKGRSERESTSEDPDQSWWCSERSVGEFRRSFRFPNDVDRDGIDASLKDGVLSITIPKTAESSVSKRIDINLKYDSSAPWYQPSRHARHVIPWDAFSVAGLLQFFSPIEHLTMAWILKLNNLFSRRWRGRRLKKQKKNSEAESKITAIKRKDSYVPQDERWRNCSDFDSWLRATSFPRDGACLRDFKASYNPPNTGFPEWLKHRAEEYMKTLQELLQQAGIQGIEWFNFPVADESADNLIHAFGILLSKTPHMPPLDSHRIYYCYETLRVYLPDKVLLPERAFHNQSLCVAKFGKKETIAIPPKSRFGSQWRNCRTVDDFVRLFNLDDDVKGYIAPPGSKIKPDLSAWLKEGAKEYLDIVLQYLRKGEWEGNWYNGIDQFPGDALIHVYAELLKISPYFDMQRLSSYHEALLRSLPVGWHRLPDHKWKQGLFPRRYLHDATGPLYGQILHRFHEFNIRHFYRDVAPYTALVGPEGHGKSFFVKQMALQNYTYVVYLLLRPDTTYNEWIPHENLTLVRPLSEGFPNRQRIFDCFIAVSLANVKLCRDVGIGPRAFFDMYAEVSHTSLNNLFKEFRKLLWHAFESLTQAVHRVTEQMRPPDCQDGDEKYWNQALKYCLGKYVALMWSKFLTIRAVLPIYQGYHDYPDRPSGDTVLKDGNPAMVLCIDEESKHYMWLPSKERKMAWYNQLIKAISSRINHQWDAPEDRFFALFVDRDPSVMPPNPSHPFPDIQIDHLK
ncbi:hypothetical protein CNMCM5793_001843 [Aspergillus hiratsukae]|uniref:SHSP domain-containing protein n=1 Tax=Aspergillus hiratsukae TaxID=1194566 RepID=A0A8H6UEX7_9EURO|nr:hypothetical protein CNMCM5793_001843 [Aspergillus hiratsukae]